MRRSVTPQEVVHVLEYRLGPELSSSDGLGRSLARTLSDWTFSAEDLEAFHQRLEDQILQELYTRLGSGMRYRSRSGQIYRILSDDLPDIADLCLALLLPRFSPSASAVDVLQRMAFEKGSYAAMLTLYRHYSETLGENNLSLIGQMMRVRAESEHMPKELYP